MERVELEELLNRAHTATQEKEHSHALDFYEQIVIETDTLEDKNLKELRMEALRERSYLLELLGRRDEALVGYEKYYLEGGSREHSVEALVLIGNLHTDVGEHRQALEAYDEALALSEAFNYTFGRAKALTGSALTLHRLGRTEEGLSNLTKALGLFRQVDDKRGQMRSLNALGIIHAQIGQIDQAINSFQDSLELAREIGERETALTLSNLGECYQSLFNMEQALHYHREALKLAEGTRLRSVEADTCRNLGFDLYSLGEVEEGIQYLQRALQISEETKQPDVKLQVLYTLALAEIERGEAATARGYAQELREIAENQNYRLYQANALHALGLCDQLEDDLEKAEQRWQEAIFLAHETGRQFLLWQLHGALAAIAPNPGLARVHYEIASDIIHQIAYPIEEKVIRESFLAAPPVQAILQHLD